MTTVDFPEGVSKYTISPPRKQEGPGECIHGGRGLISCWWTSGTFFHHHPHSYFFWELSLPYTATMGTTLDLCNPDCLTIVCWFSIRQLTQERGGTLKITSRARDFPIGLGVKKPPCNAGDMSSIPGHGTKISPVEKQLSPCHN